MSLYGRLVRRGASGVLTVRRGKRFLRRYFDGGLPVWFDAGDRAEVSPELPSAAPVPREWSSREQAEEFLRLAATFDPQHVQAWEYMARIALDVADNEPARQRLEHLLKMKPDASWARAAMSRLPPTDDGGRRRLAFWSK